MDITRLLRATARSRESPMTAQSDAVHWTYAAGNRPAGCESPPLQPFASGGQLESSAAYVLWPPSSWVTGSAEERAAYFNDLQKKVERDWDGDRMPSGRQASTLIDLMTIRAFHSKSLRLYSLGTALGFRTRQGALTNIPAIIVFVARKVHGQWLLDMQKLPTILEGPGRVWCDVDVVEFSYYGPPVTTPKEQIYTELVEGLRGNDASIGSGSQVASQETYGTLGAVVQSQIGFRQIGFLTNRHVAVDLDYPAQKMFHPLPPNLGPGVYLGAVERATSFIRDDLWYGIFAGMNPETFVRADGAFIPFTETFDLSKVTTSVKGMGEMSDLMRVDLRAPIDSLIGRRVAKVGRSSGLTRGVIMAYAVEYNDEKGNCFFTDFLIVGESKLTFELEGDSGSLIMLAEGQHAGAKPQPIGIIWGGTANRGCLKLRNGHGPENWTSGVDLGRLLDMLQLDIITTNDNLQEAMKVQQWCMSSAADILPSDDSGGIPDGDGPEVTKLPVTAKDLLSVASFDTIARPRAKLKQGSVALLDSNLHNLNVRTAGSSTPVRTDSIDEGKDLSLAISAHSVPAQTQAEPSFFKKRELAMKESGKELEGIAGGDTAGVAHIPNNDLFEPQIKRNRTSGP